MTRQAYYQYQGRQSRRYERRGVVLAAVRQVRQLHPRMGVRKLLHKVRPVVQRVGICIGRDQLYRVMREADLLVKRRRRRVTIRMVPGTVTKILRCAWLGVRVIPE
jgi:hypothetical protein